MKKIILIFLAISISLGLITYYQFGDTTHPSATQSAYAGDYLYYHKIDVTTACTLDSFVVYVTNASGIQPIRCALYADNGSGAPTGTPLDSSAAGSLHTGTAELVSMSAINKIELAVGTYHIAKWANTGYTAAKGAGGSANWGFQGPLEYTTNVWPSASRSGTGSFIDNDVYIVGSITTADETQDKGFKERQSRKIRLQRIPTRRN